MVPSKKIKPPTFSVSKLADMEQDGTALVVGTLQGVARQFLVANVSYMVASGTGYFVILVDYNDGEFNSIRRARERVQEDAKLFPYDASDSLKMAKAQKAAMLAAVNMATNDLLENLL